MFLYLFILVIASRAIFDDWDVVGCLFDMSEVLDLIPSAREKPNQSPEPFQVGVLS